MSVAMPRTNTRGVVYVHSTPKALCPHIVWAVEGVLGLWTLVFPMSFYANVPTVDLTPPFRRESARIAANPAMSGTSRPP